jgi:hypothetical protein
MIATSERLPEAQTDASRFANLPVYELRLKVAGREGYELQVWQLPSPATPRVKTPEYVAALQGAALRLVEPRVLKKLARAKIHLGAMRAGKAKSWALDEELALQLGLLFRALAPMRSLDRIRQVAEGIDEMSREEAGYWLGMAMHRKHPRRVLAALRMLLAAS